MKLISASVPGGDVYDKRPDPEIDHLFADIRFSPRKDAGGCSSNPHGETETKQDAGCPQDGQARRIF